MFEEYEEAAARTAVYPRRGENLAYAVCGLAGEAGEVAGRFSKVLRGDYGLCAAAGAVPAEVRAMLADELGDVLWFLAAAAFECGTSLEEVARRNIEKLASRAERGVLRGDGGAR